MVEPLLDVFSFTIFPTNLPCAVYGDITVYDKLDSIAPTYELYRRDAEHAELISELGQALSAVGLDKVLLFQQPVISFNLKVKDSRAAVEEEDAFIARGTANLDIDTNNDFEEVKQSDVKGDCGHATVNYIALSFALVAHVNICLYGYWDSAASDAHQHTLSQQVSDLKSFLYGTIFAQYGNSFGNADQFRISLLNVPSHQSIPLFFEDYEIPTVKLTRNYFAIPAYSFMKIKGNLRSTLSSMSVVDEEDTVIVWSRHGPPSSKSHRNTVPDRWLNVFRTTANWLPRYLVQQFTGHTKTKPFSCGWKVMMEVFSVFIGRINDHNLNISGTISITLKHDNSKFALFKRDDKNPDKLLDGRKLLAITYPSVLEFCSPCIILSIAVKLMDSDRGFLIEDFVDINTLVADDDEPMFNTPLCSVIPTENGFCALHYTLFKSATKVSLEIVLLCKGVDVAKVHGKIVAWSDMLDYTRDYNKKYHQRVLYDKSKAQIYYPQKAVSPSTTIQSSLDERKYGEVKLSESCVAVPIDFRYNIGVDLYASSHTRSCLPEHLHKTLQLQYDKNKRVKKMHIAVGDFVLCIQNV